MDTSFCTRLSYVEIRYTPTSEFSAAAQRYSRPTRPGKDKPRQRWQTIQTMMIILALLATAARQDAMTLTRTRGTASGEEEGTGTPSWHARVRSIATLSAFPCSYHAASTTRPIDGIFYISAPETCPTNVKNCDDASCCKKRPYYSLVVPYLLPKRVLLFLLYIQRAPCPRCQLYPRSDSLYHRGRH